MPLIEEHSLRRRVGAIEAHTGAQDLIYVKTIIVEIERGKEKLWRDPNEVIADESEPRLREVRRVDDLEVIIDPVSQVKKVRNDLDSAEQDVFDEIKNDPTTKRIVVEIKAHAEQVAAILSPKPIVSVFGANRAGKSIVLIWWLFRRWLLRGAPGRVFWWVSPTLRKSVEQGVDKIFGAGAQGGGMWPDGLFHCKNPITKNSQSPEVWMVDGSVIQFQTGAKDGSNLKSANVHGAVIDEFSSILNYNNLYQVQVRLSQSHGHLAVATTRVSDHWSNECFAQQTKKGWVHESTMELFHNPWLTHSAIWKVLVSTRALSPDDLEYVLGGESIEDQIARARSRVTDPDALREHFGVNVETGFLLWKDWTGEEIVTESDFQQGFLLRKGKKFWDITSDWLAKHWPRAATTGYIIGMDFNVEGHAVGYKLFAPGSTKADAWARKDSWVLCATHEVAQSGKTITIAEEMCKTLGGKNPIYCDPTGGKPNSGHSARGTGGTSDVAVLERYGFQVRTAVEHGDLNFVKSANVLNVLMHEQRLVVHRRCLGLLDALKHDKAAKDRRRAKTYGSGSKSDERSGYTDSLRYGAYPVFRAIVDPVEISKLYPQV